MKEIKLYNKYNDGRHWEKHPTIYDKSFLEFLKQNKFSGKILDAGCGNGRDSNVFYNSGYETIGIDYSKKEIDNAKKLNPKLNLEVQNIEKLNFHNNEVSAFFV